MDKVEKFIVFISKEGDLGEIRKFEGIVLKDWEGYWFTYTDDDGILHRKKLGIAINCAFNSIKEAENALKRYFDEKKPRQKRYFR